MHRSRKVREEGHGKTPPPPVAAGSKTDDAKLSYGQGAGARPHDDTALACVDTGGEDAERGREIGAYCAMFHWVKDFLDIFEKRELIYTLALADFRKKFVGSFLGVFWMFIQPMITVLIYFFVFQMGFKSQPVSDVPYVLWLIAGIVPWFFFNESWGGATNCLYEYSHLVKKMVFKVSILPIIKIAASFLVHLIFIWIMIIVYLISGEDPSIWWLQILYYSFCAAFLSLGLSYITASANVFFKDMGQLVQVFLQIGMWMAPIMWSETMMPEKIRWIVKLNPFYYIVEGYRDCMIRHIGFWQHGKAGIYFWCVSAVLFAVGTALFKKLKPHFADVL